jgi:UDP-N-acetylmuramate dehydrogenase
VVDAAWAEAMKDLHPGLPVFPGGESGLRKLSAAWMIESAGWKGYREGDAGIAAQHALVLVNHGQATGAQLLALAHRVADSVAGKFGVALEPEPRLIGASWQGG